LWALAPSLAAAPVLRLAVDKLTPEGVIPTKVSVLALFSGAAGTGTTLAAAVLARAVAILRYRADRARVVSQYVGETDKNLD
jgi:SpoVK/Ycf46/Vps4 family AAA+-type ATPase